MFNGQYLSYLIFITYQTTPEHDFGFMIDEFQLKYFVSSNQNLIEKHMLALVCREELILDNG